jgi:hypothetical protein
VFCAEPVERGWAMTSFSTLFIRALKNPRGDCPAAEIAFV